jgi:glyoxylase-like metal-dependent hydrolase (beta-lactamase superfamily II)
MDRRDVLRMLSGATLAAMGGRVWAVDKPPPKPGFDTAKIVAEKIRDGIYCLSGPGGNIGVLIGEDGVLLVDCGVTGRTDAIKAAVAEISPKPIRTLVNTHWHFDHTGGNEFLGKTGVAIVAHDNVRQRLSTDQTIALLNMKFPAAPAVALPVVSFNDTLTLHRNGETLHLAVVPPAHTDGDTIVRFAKANVVHMGDLFFNGVYPVIDSSSGGTVDGMIAAAERVLKLTDAETKIIPGHGPLATAKELKQARDLLATLREAILPLIKAGKTVEEAVAAKPTRTLDDQYGKGFVSGDLVVRMFYPSLQAAGK